MKIPGVFMKQKVVLERFIAVTGVGEKFDDPVTCRARVEDLERTVASGSTEVVSSTTVWVDPQHWVPPGSMVTVWPGTERERRAKALQVAFHEGGGMPSHAQLFLE